MTIDNQPEDIRAPRLNYTRIIARYMAIVHENRKDPDTFGDIAKHVIHARIQHPWPVGVSRWYKTRVLLSEVREFLWAVFWERDTERIREEALDVIAVLIKWIEGDGECQ